MFEAPTQPYGSRSQHCSNHVARIVSVDPLWCSCRGDRSKKMAVDPTGRFRLTVVAIMGFGCAVSLLSGTFLAYGASI